MKVLVGLEPQFWSFEMGVTPKIEGSKAFKEHLIGNTSKIEKYSKGNFIESPLKKTLQIIPFKVQRIPHSRPWCLV